MQTRFVLVFALVALNVLLVRPALAEKKYDTGASDTEIKIGQTMPYSGPASAYATIGHAEAAYFKMLNEHGGINGRKITLISLDDGYSPAKAVDGTRRLVEEKGVLLIFSSLGTPTNTAIHKYLNDRKIPQLLILSGADKFADPKHFPWTMSAIPSYQMEAHIYGKYILQARPDAKIAVLYQNDDFGKDYVIGLRKALGPRADKMIVAEASYEVSDPTISSQIAALKGSGADVFVNASTPKFAAMAIRGKYDIGWKAEHIMSNVSTSIAAVMRPAGMEKSVGIISGLAAKPLNDKQWDNDPGMVAWLKFMKDFYPLGNAGDGLNFTAYSVAILMGKILEACGDDLTRANVMRQAANMHHVQLPANLPGITFDTSPTDYRGFKQLRLARFDGHTWVYFGEVIAANGQ